MSHTLAIIPSFDTILDLIDLEINRISRFVIGYLKSLILIGR